MAALMAMTLILPWAVVLGIGAPEPKGWRRWFCRLGGELSYPLYMIHVPAAQALMAIAYWTGLTRDVALKEYATTDLPLRAAFLIPPIVALAWLALRIYDEAREGVAPAKVDTQARRRRDPDGRFRSARAPGGPGSKAALIAAAIATFG